MDAAYSWENPNGLGPRLNVIPVDLRNSRTLRQTTDWPRWALERCAHVHPTMYWEDIVEVRLKGCAVGWKRMGSRNSLGDGTIEVHCYNAGSPSSCASFRIGYG